MCGILFSANISNLPFQESSYNIADKYVSRRGPNFSNIKILEPSYSCRISMYSSTLHVRGSEISKQPLSSNNGLYFQYNGEMFGSNYAMKEESDTAIIFSNIVDSDLNLPETLIAIFRSFFGPFSFTLYDENANIVYFGRDQFGRRSLLMRSFTLLEEFMQNSLTVFELSSVRTEYLMQYKWENVPCGKLFSYNINSKEVEFLGMFSEDISKSFDNFSLDQQLYSLDFLVKKFSDIFDRATVRHLEFREFEGIKWRVLFSGGIDSTLVAAYLARNTPEKDVIILSTISFEKNSPDLKTAHRSYLELTKLFSHRQFILDERLYSKNDYHANLCHFKHLAHPDENSSMNLSIGSALWFATLTSESYKRKNLSPIVFLGSGADELCAGYTRHRKVFNNGSVDALNHILKEDIEFIGVNNIGRDDRFISDLGFEARCPFLDEEVVRFLISLPLVFKFNPDLPRGKGEKFILRKLALYLGFSEEIAFTEKRAIQFGTKLAKIQG